MRHVLLVLFVSMFAYVLYQVATKRERKTAWRTIRKHLPFTVILLVAVVVAIAAAGNLYSFRIF